MVGRTAAVALALAVALAGCTQVSAETVALEAAEGLQSAWTDTSGALQRMEIRIGMGLGEAASVELAGTIEMHEGDAATVTFGVASADLGDPEAEEGLDALRLLLYCGPERLVLRTEGLAAMGMEDADMETANSAGTCVGDGTAVLGDMQRLLGGLDPMLATMLDSVSLEPPSLELVEASWEGKDVVAVYEVGADDATMRLTATIRDDRIVLSEAGFEAGPMGSMSMTTEYVYGPRSADPGLRGAERV